MSHYYAPSYGSAPLSSQNPGHHSQQWQPQPQRPKPAMSSAALAMQYQHPTTLPTTAPEGVDPAEHAAYVANYTQWYDQYILPLMGCAPQTPLADSAPQAWLHSSVTSPSHFDERATAAQHHQPQQHYDPLPYRHVNSNLPYNAPQSCVAPPSSHSPQPHSAPPPIQSHPPIDSRPTVAPFAINVARPEHRPIPSKRGRWDDPTPQHPQQPPVTLPLQQSSAPPPAAATNDSSAWPRPVVDYVGMSLSACPPHMKAEVEQWLRTRIERAVTTDELHTIQWEKEPLAHRLVASATRPAELPVHHQTTAPAHKYREYVVNGNHSHPQPVPSPNRKRWRDTDDSQDPHAHNANNSKGNQRKQKSKNGDSHSHSKSSSLFVADEVDLRRNEDRASRFSHYLKTEAATPTQRQIRKDLFLPNAGDDSGEGGEIDWASLKIVGTGEALEKSYLRLTQAPDPSTVRSGSALHRSLAHCLLKWRAEKNYKYVCDQLKSIRQDLTVQGIRDAFTVEVYETHARIALEVGDWSEFTQCQTVLVSLYHDSPTLRQHQQEFTVYRILYSLATNNKHAIGTIVRELTAEQHRQPHIALALSLRQALNIGEFYVFLRLSKSVPFMGGTLIAPLVAAQRFRALTILVRSFKPTKVECGFFQRALAFDNVEETLEFLVSCGAQLSEDKQLLLTSVGVLKEPESKERVENEEKKGITHAMFSHS